MDYVRQLEEFYSSLDYNNLSTNAIAVYSILLHIASKTKFLKEFNVANTTLTSKCSLTIKQLQNARNELITKKYIAYKKGRNQNDAPKYSISILYNDSDTKTGQAEGQALGQPHRQPVRQALGQPLGYINTLHYNTTLDLFFNYINNSAQDFFENGKDKINLQDKAIIVMHLKKLGIFVEDTRILEVFTEVKLLEIKIFYWAIKEIYFSAYKVYLNKLTYNNLCLRFLKAKEYVATEEGIDLERLIAYFIKCVQTELKEGK